jgi:hypothetical protein
VGVQKQIAADVVHVNWRRKTRWRRRAGWAGLALVVLGSLGYMDRRIAELAKRTAAVEVTCAR